MFEVYSGIAYFSLLAVDLAAFDRTNVNKLLVLSEQASEQSFVSKVLDRVSFELNGHKSLTLPTATDATSLCQNGRSMQC